MKKQLLLFTFLVSAMTYAQVGNGFENLTGITFDGGVCRYYDADNTTTHELQNYTAPCGVIFVKEDSSGSTLGYSIVLDPSTPNGPNGFTDGDAFGVASSIHLINDFDISAPEGSQAFVMEDPDGTVTMSFDVVDLGGTGNPQFSMQYLLESTSWEASDFLKITIEFTDCASPTLTLLDTSGFDINNLGIEDTWNTLSADLTAYVDCNAQLIIEFSSNSAAEELGLDAIAFSSGMTLSNENLNVNEATSVVPNPSNGMVTIKNTVVALTQITLTDINGRHVANYDLNRITQDQQLDLSSVVTTGLYFMIISSENGSTVKKIIIK
ncbi:T9SS type A sorting domain-containing protein [Psychroserpens damuponensis]|uniref:T9SS type A sorting domain-containing protein n=1 Tax=Psychroserpens damuponensis TaxID=943936 RepID=UPI00058B6955|nr:T9SS type A sorting domain-containing protein [Psychroserpens damuponensis]